MNIAKLNTASLDDKTFIIKRGNGGGSTPDTPSGERRYAYITNESYKADFVLNASLSLYVSAVKANFNGMTIASPSLIIMANSMGGNIEPIALSIDLDMVAYTPTGNATIEETLAQDQALKEKWEALPKLTKEEFYSLD